LRLPTRTRGVVLGMTTLVLGPVLAVTLISASEPAAGHSGRADVQTVARIQTRVVAPLAVVELREPTDVPAPPPPPAVVAAPKAAPRPRVAPPAFAGPPASPGSIVAIIEAAAARWGVSGAWMVSIAQCESGLRPTAYNPRGPYIGLFQFLPSTFAGNGGTSIYDPYDQANIAAKMLAHGQAHQWSCA
jgi:soluble lytic murein transglycosylase-like protein